VALKPTAGIGGDDMLSWEISYYDWWGMIAKSCGLEWGGDFPHTYDGPHVQMPR